MFKSIKRYKGILSLTLAILLVFGTFSGSPANAEIEPFVDPCIELDKTAEPTSEDRTYEVELKITGTLPEDKQVDVVLVIDRSGSMNQGTEPPIIATKAAAVRFAESIISGNPASRVALVSYSAPASTGYSLMHGSYYGSSKPTPGQSASVDQVLTSELGDITSAINALTAGGGTDIMSAFIIASNLIQTSSLPDDQKVIVLMSDGVANFGSWERKHVLFTGNRWFRDPAVDWPTSANKHTNLAVAEGKNAQAHAQVFTVGLFDYVSNNYPGSLAVAQKTLQDAATPGKYYEAASAENLDTIYQAIASAISNAGTGAVVTDVIAPEFEFVEFVLDSPSKGTANYDSSNATITWNIGEIPAGETTLKYIIRAKDSFAGSKNETDLIPTNVEAYMDYITTGGFCNTEYFPVPEVFVPGEQPVEPTIGISKTVSPGAQFRNRKVTYTITVTNYTSSKLYNVTLNDEMLGIEDFNIGDLEPGGSWTKNYEYTIPSDAEIGSKITNEACVNAYLRNLIEFSRINLSSSKVKTQNINGVACGVVSCKGTIIGAKGENGTLLNGEHDVIFLLKRNEGAGDANGLSKKLTFADGRAGFTISNWVIPGASSISLPRDLYLKTNIFADACDSATVTVRRPGGGGGGGGGFTPVEEVTVDEEPAAAPPPTEEPPVDLPSADPQPEPAVTPEEPAVGDLPFTGGNAALYIYAGLALVGAAALLRRRYV